MTYVSTCPANTQHTEDVKVLNGIKAQTPETLRSYIKL